MSEADYSINTSNGTNINMDPLMERIENDPDFNY